LEVLVKEALLIKYGEICLRGLNRRSFEMQLLREIKRRLTGIKNIRVAQEYGLFFVESLDGAMDYNRIIPLLTKVFGVVSVSPCVQTDDQSLDSLCETALRYMKNYFGAEPFTFKVQTKRANKAYPIHSQKISAEIGGYLLENMPLSRVDVHKPQVVLRVELRTQAFLFAKVIKACGGLPYGSSGKGVLLLSGGIDSPAAGFLLAKRGVEVIAVYFHAPPYTSERAKDKVIDLARALSRFTGRLKLYVIPFTQTQLTLYETVPQDKLTLLIKRSMLRIAEKIALQEGAQCLITGDSVGQVASQTLHSLLAVQSAVRLPILRPLSGLNKQEIIDLAVQIETYDISIRPYEDCCTIFVAKHPETKPKPFAIESAEEMAAGLNDKEQAAVNNASVLWAKANEGFM
jgi:thiamine biosynthesis protein ThiI